MDDNNAKLILEKLDDIEKLRPKVEEILAAVRALASSREKPKAKAKSGQFEVGQRVTITAGRDAGVSGVITRFWTGRDGEERATFETSDGEEKFEKLKYLKVES